MPISFRQAGNLFVAGPNINIYPSGNTYAISGSASGSGGSGVTGLTSAGTGNILVFSSITNNNLVQKSLSAGTGISIIDNGLGLLTFSATSTGGGSGTITSGTSIGTGTAIFSGVSGSNLIFRTLKAGPNAAVYTSGNDIIISATTGTINGVSAITNTGGAAIILSSITNNTLIARTISGSNGIQSVESGNVILVRPSGLSASELVIAGTNGLLTTSDFYQVDATNGTMSLGFSTPNVVNTSARLLIDAGTATISQLRLIKFSTNLTANNDGDIWYATSGNTLKFNKNSVFTDFIFRDNNSGLSGGTDLKILESDSGGTLSSTRNLIAFGVFNAISSVTISNTTLSSSTISNSIVGSQTLLSSTDSKNPQLIAGKKYRFNARGTIQTTATTAGAFNVNFRLGSVVIASSATFTLQNGIPANSYFEIDTTFTIKTQGTGGTVNGSGKMLTDYTNLETSGSQIKSITSLGDVTLDTTASRLFDCHVTFTTASTNNRIVINESTLEFLN